MTCTLLICCCRIRFVAAVENQLTEAASAKLHAQYAQLCCPGLAISTEGFGPGTRGAAWAAARGLQPSAAYGAAALEALAGELKAVAPPFVAAL